MPFLCDMIDIDGIVMLIGWGCILEFHYTGKILFNAIIMSDLMHTLIFMKPVGDLQYYCWNYIKQKNTSSCSKWYSYLFKSPAFFYLFIQGFKEHNSTVQDSYK